MPPRRQGNRTIAEPIFVRPSLCSDCAMDAALLLGRVARDGQVKAPGDESQLQTLIDGLSYAYCEQTVFPLEGEISRAMTKLKRSKLAGLCRDAKDGLPRYVEGLLEAKGVLSDPHNVPAFRKILNGAPKKNSQELWLRLREGDLSVLNLLFTRVARNGGTKGRVDLFPSPSQVRAAQTVARCVVLCRESPFTMIARARDGNRQAVLELIKIDKAFLHDRCTRKVIIEAESKCDRGFIQQLARALRHEPKFSTSKRIRLLLFGLMDIGIKLPVMSKLQRLLDPEGTYFKGDYAFERFVRRCRNEFEQLCIAPPPARMGSRKEH